MPVVGRFVAASLVGSLLCPGWAQPQSPTPTPTPRTPPRPERPSGRETKPPFKSFAVYALSRAKGVPPEAREALRKVRELVEGDHRRGLNVKVETKRIGIEGETRVCAEYEDPKDAGRAFERASTLVKGVDLVNLVVEPCDKSAAPDKGQREEEKP